MVDKEEKYIPRYKKKYSEEIVSKLKEKIGYSNINQVPSLEKIVVNIGVGEASRNPKVLDSAIRDLRIITAQKPKICKAKKSVSNFKVREGMAIGVMVTLRGNRMWDFFDRLVNYTMPRIRDFRGLSTDGFDGRGNYNMGIDEQIVFPEIEYDKVDAIRGMNITFVTTAGSDEEGIELLRALDFPFKRMD